MFVLRTISNLTEAHISSNLYELLVDPLGHDDEGQLGLVVVPEGLKGRLQLRDLDVPGVVESAVADAVAEDNDAVGQLVVDALILSERFADVVLKKIDNFNYKIERWPVSMRGCALLIRLFYNTFSETYPWRGRVRMLSTF